MSRMRKTFVLVLLILCYSAVYAEANELDPRDVEKISRVRYECEGVLGYVFFEGFDFKGYRGDSGGIEAMLARTLMLLQQYYKSSGQPFVFVGHSQGGVA